MNKEQTYDTELYPLVQRIIEICKREKIAMVASFSIPTEIEPDLIATTSLADENGKQPIEYIKCMREIYKSAEPLMYKITSNGSTEGDKKTTYVSFLD